MLATIGAAVLTSMVAARRVSPPEPTTEPDQGHPDRQPGADDGAEREQQDEQRGDDADDLAVAVHRGGGGAGQVPAELDLEAGVTGVGDGVLEGLEVLVEVGVGDRLVVADHHHRGVAVLGDPRRGDRDRVVHGQQPVGQRGELGVGGAPAVVAVHDHLGRGVAGTGDVGAELVDAALGGCAGDVPVVDGGAAVRAGEAEHDAGGEDPGAERAPGVQRGAAAEPVEEARHEPVLRVWWCEVTRLGRAAWGLLGVDLEPSGLVQRDGLAHRLHDVRRHREAAVACPQQVPLDAADVRR